MVKSSVKHFRLPGLIAAKLAVLLVIAWGWSALSVAAADAGITEQQIKALCLFNFTKYVDWPPEAFATADAPIRIGIAGDKKIGATLKAAVAGKMTGTHPLEVVELTSPEESASCHILFVSASESKRFAEALAALKGRNILTVGENEQFAQDGGIITFTRRENKVRFEVNLAAARSAGLQISSKMLSLADVVRGRE